MFDGPNPLKTPAEIAKSVRVGSRLQVGNAELARLKARVGEIGDEIRRLNGARLDSNMSGISTLLLDLDRERSELIDKLRSAARSSRCAPGGRLRSGRRCRR